MVLCKYCEDIDPSAAIGTTDTENPERCRRVLYDLQRSGSMRLSAQNGCSGCRFFLDVLRLETSDKNAVGDTLQLNMRVWIEAPSKLAIKMASNTTMHPLDLCLVQGTIPRITTLMCTQTAWFWG